MTKDEVCSYVEDKFNSHWAEEAFGPDPKYDAMCAIKCEEDGLWNVALIKKLGLHKITINCIFDENTLSIGAPEMPN